MDVIPTTEAPKLTLTTIGKEHKLDQIQVQREISEGIFAFLASLCSP